MALQILNIPENSLNFEKFKKNPKNSNMKSFWTFLTSIFIYISVFYIFNLSPSALFSTTKFWFFISNTLILIIAADFGSFSSSKEHDFYEEYVKNTVRSKTDPYFDTKHVEIVERTIPNDQKLDKKSQVLNEKLKETKCVRSNSDKAIITEAVAAEEKLGLRWTLSERCEEQIRVEENEFSRMSDEELNKRVEEFIRKFNRQIRLQAIQTRQTSELHPT